MAKRKQKPTGKQSSKSRATNESKPLGLRIVGGRFRGRKLQYGGDRRVRPMKDRVREAMFNLVGPGVRGKHAIDLFAGTGAIGLEAVSRGAVRATFIEQHFPTAKVLQQNVASLDVGEITQIHTANVFIWLDRGPDLGETPWVVFCSPPYDFFVERTDEILGLINTLIENGPIGSIFVVESDERFDFEQLPSPDEWDVRKYSPAVVGVWRKANEHGDTILVN